MAKDRVFITEGDRYLFGMGTHYEIYEKLGAHKASADDGTKAYILRYGRRMLKMCM